MLQGKLILSSETQDILFDWKVSDRIFVSFVVCILTPVTWQLKQLCLEKPSTCHTLDTRINKRIVFGGGCAKVC